jgi:hypothetical protein
MGFRATQKEGLVAWRPVLLNHAAAACINRGQLREAGLYLNRIQHRSLHSLEVHDPFYLSVSMWLEWLMRRGPIMLGRVTQIADLAALRHVPYLEVMVSISLSVLLEDGGYLSEAIAHAEQALARARMARAAQGEWVARAIRIYLAWRTERTPPPLRSVESIFAAVRDQGFQHYYVWPRRAFALLCAVALEHETLPSHALQLVEIHKMSPPRDYPVPEAWPFRLKIFTFGRFEIQLGGQRYPFGHKLPRIRMKLLKAIVALGGRDVSKDELARNVWPTRRTGRRKSLQTELNRLRKDLGGEILQVRTDTVTLDTDSTWTDVDYLQHLTGLPDSAERLARARERLEGGEFLSGESMPAAVARREMLNELLGPRDR